MPDASTRWAVHVLCHGLLACILFQALGQRVLRPYVVGAAVQVDESSFRPTGYQLDPNVANWSELACLPGIGPVLSRRIVEYREQRRASAADASADVYHVSQDLLAVTGIGPKRLARIRPYLKFP